MDRFAVCLVMVAVLCTLISIITEFTKEVGVLKKIPTSFQVLITSVIVCEVGLFVGLSFYLSHSICVVLSCGCVFRGICHCDFMYPGMGLPDIDIQAVLQWRR